MGFEALSAPEYASLEERWKDKGQYAVPDMEVLAGLMTKPELGILMAVINSAFAKVPTDERYANRKMEALLRLKSHVETAIKARSQDDKAPVQVILVTYKEEGTVPAKTQKDVP